MKLEKITNDSIRSEKRWYDDACGTALALELVGERWSLLIVRELMFGARRFSELKNGLPGISANVLTQRLAGMERAGILIRRMLPPPANAQVYELTPWGYEAEESIAALGRWAARSPDHDPNLHFSPASAMLSLRTMLDRERARDERLTIAFRFGREAFVGRLADGALVITRDVTDHADATLTGTPHGMAGFIYSKEPIAELAAAGVLMITGDLAAALRFADLFALPPQWERATGT